MSLTFKALRQVNLERLAHFPGHTENPWNTADWMVAVTGEVGELANKLKKIRRGVVKPGNDGLPSMEQVAREVADIAIYLDLLAAHLYIDLESAIREKFNETSENWNLPDRL